jgi:hypothetical protein
MSSLSFTTSTKISWPDFSRLTSTNCARLRVKHVELASSGAASEAQLPTHHQVVLPFHLYLDCSVVERFACEMYSSTRFSGSMRELLLGPFAVPTRLSPKLQYSSTFLPLLRLMRILRRIGSWLVCYTWVLSMGLSASLTGHIKLLVVVSRPFSVQTLSSSLTLISWENDGPWLASRVV